MQIKRPCAVRIGLEKGFLHGTTENITRDGALIRLDEGIRLKRGQMLDIEILMNENHHFGLKCMFCRSVVAWTTKEEGGWVKVGVRFESVDFREASRFWRREASAAVQ